MNIVNIVVAIFVPLILNACTNREREFIGDWSNNPSGANGGSGILIEISQDGDKILVRHELLPSRTIFAQSNAKIEGDYLVLTTVSNGAFEKFMHVKANDSISPVGMLSDVVFYHVK